MEEYFGWEDVFCKGVQFQVGNGSQIAVWENPWIPLPHSFKPFSPIMEGMENMRVKDLIDPENNDWMILWLEEFFSKEEANLIASIPLSIKHVDDRLVWYFKKKKKEFLVSRVCTICRVILGRLHMPRPLLEHLVMSIGCGKGCDTLMSHSLLRYVLSSGDYCVVFFPQRDHFSQILFMSSAIMVWKMRCICSRIVRSVPYFGTSVLLCCISETIQSFL